MVNNSDINKLLHDATNMGELTPEQNQKFIEHLSDESVLKEEYTLAESDKIKSGYIGKFRIIVSFTGDDDGPDCCDFDLWYTDTFSDYFISENPKTTSSDYVSEILSNDLDIIRDLLSDYKLYDGMYEIIGNMYSKVEYSPGIQEEDVEEWAEITKYRKLSKEEESYFIELNKIGFYLTFI